jgi:hypothetical protein
MKEQTIAEAIWVEGWIKGEAEGKAKGELNASRWCLKLLMENRFGPL